MSDKKPEQNASPKMARPQAPPMEKLTKMAYDSSIRVQASRDKPTKK